MALFEERYKSLNKKQREAVDTIYGPVMVVAGPGTGKTTVLTLRIANILLKTDAKPDEILALTFTEAGARNMREKLRTLIGDTSFRVNIFTFHGFANYIRGIYPENFLKIGERVPASDSDKIEVIEYILSKKSFKELRVSDFGISIGKISGRISDLKRELISPKDLKKLISKIEPDPKKEKYEKRINEFAELYEEYEKELEKRKLYDFDDAILELIDTLKENDEMRAEVRERFQFVLADEHQDANGAQNEILRLFRNDKEADSPNIFVVGDDKQSIFRFQGASLEHFYNFSDEFPGAVKIALEDNYRSQKLILEGSHSLISRDGRKHQKLSSNVTHPEKKIEIVEYSDYETELANVAKEIKKSGGTGSVAVLARNNQALFDLAQYLEAEKVDFKIAGERSLFEDFEYRKLFTLLEAICDPYEGRLLKALYAGYFALPIHEILQLAGEARKSREDFAKVFLGTEGAATVKELISKAKKTFVTDMLKELRETMYDNATPASYDALKAVFEEARKLVVKKRGATLDDLVSHLKFLEKHNLAPLSGEVSRSSKVELLSIHRSKGLEYDYVYIIDATAKKFEGSGKRADLLAIPGIGIDTELEEERRLLYVAMTRAKQHVTLSYALRGVKGEDNAPTSLLEEIDPEFSERRVAMKESEKPDLLKTLKPTQDEKIAIYREAFLTRSFSVSALNNYLDCPWKYFFRNLLLIPDAPEYHTNLGNACHNILKTFHLAAAKGNILAKQELKNVIKTSVLREPFSESELPLAFEKALEYIEAYIASFIPFKEGEKAHVEEGFSFIYKTSDFEVPITGKIDLAREVDGRVKVIDFKTKKRMTRNAIMGKTKNDSGNEWRQLQFYKFLLENAKPDFTVNEGILTFLNPEEGKILSEAFLLGDADKKEIEAILQKVLASIYNFEFWNSKCSDKECGYCALSRQILG